MKLTVEMRSADDLSTIAQLAEVLNEARCDRQDYLLLINKVAFNDENKKHIDDCNRGLILAATLTSYFKRRLAYFEGQPLT